MVTASGTDNGKGSGGDGVMRTFQYASFRTDKPASEGYSAELISNRVNK